ncbi:uncharacterized protein PFL1_03294 [Pseudozyma flocculosa PF-1]|uniref:Peptidase metallopeptidase domain-containing protein n=2 Tax=Pseudozyma flocculosa TaxID=84751 RepID=A0A5C3F8E6_9BASI|nr:uncharacterized protein PFL1_03294 [Pseudozyma flocculosa PF-1]EPQ29004.1 hypothetical protein PFL1_03294 [Pseudozyma flocculosa PF-1]SPO39997.1 uncharacterized protein PSFLO_05479 [Pseudozyma flocculosa]
MPQTTLNGAGGHATIPSNLYGGRLAAHVPDVKATLLYAVLSSGRIAEAIIKTDWATNALVYDTVPGTLDASCHSSSRISVLGDSTAWTLVYQAQDGAIVKRQFAGTPQPAWSGQEVVVPIDQPDKPLVGSMLELYSTAAGAVLIWQSESGKLLRTALRSKATTPVAGLRLFPGNRVVAQTASHDDATLCLLYYNAMPSRAMALRGPSDPASSSPFTPDDKFYPGFKAPTVDFAMVKGTQLGTGPRLVYNIEADGRVAEWTEQVTQPSEISAAGSATIDRYYGMAVASLQGRAADRVFVVDLGPGPGGAAMLCKTPSDSWTKALPLKGTSDWAGHSVAEPAGGSGNPGDNHPAPPINSDAVDAVFAGPDFGKSTAKEGGSSADTGSKPADAGQGDAVISIRLGAWIRKTCQDIIEPGQTKTATASADEVLKRPINKDGKPKTHAVNAVIANREKLWSSNPQDIRFFFMEGTPQQQDKVRTVIDEWTWYANVRFVEVGSPADSQVRIRFDPSDGSYSYVGTDCEMIDGDKHTMNLGWIDRTSSLTRNERATILHEFGHVLGLLHEHQSPAHGGIAVQNVDLALELYRRKQGWSDKQIHEQVIDVYGAKEVSNYSQVDTTSIMQYPQPKELTGLKEDIPFNTELSQLDKAYMVLQYPRPRPHAKAPEWTIDYALKVAGCPADIAQKVLASSRTDLQPNSEEIDPTQIRKIVGAWAKEAHNPNPDAVPDSRGGASSDTVAHGVDGENEDEAEDVADQKALLQLLMRPVGEDTVTVASGGRLINICASGTESETTSKAQGPASVGAPAHAVTVTTNLLPLAYSNDKRMKIRYAFSPGYRPPSSHQKLMLVCAFELWSQAAHIEFVEETRPEKASDADLLICFHDNNEGSATSARIDPDSSHRSMFLGPGGDSGDRSKLKELRHSARRQEYCAQKGYSTVPFDILYYGIFRDADAARAWQSQERRDIDGIQYNLRTLLHELGHFLGLDHECVGLYSAWINSKRFDDKAAALKLKATKYDTGSVMDAIGNLARPDLARLLTTKGLEQAETEAFTIAGFPMERVRMSLRLSKYDKANIALLYPGPSNLVQRRDDADEMYPWQLRRHEDDRTKTVLEHYLALLQVEDAFGTIKVALEMGQWETARRKYLKALDAQMGREYDSRKVLEQAVLEQMDIRRQTAAAHGDANGEVRYYATWKEDLDDAPSAAHAVNGQPDTSTGSDSAAKNEGPFIETLYKKLLNYFPPGVGQYFALQFPTRFIDKESYAYDTSGIFSRFEKPVVVNEAEFRLTDALYPLGPIVGGPNGQSLSSNYLKALNAISPSYDGIAARKQREKMRAWLLTQTHSDDAAYTVDTRLTVPGLNAQAAQKLSEESGIRVMPADKPTSQGGAVVTPLSAVDPSDPSVALAKSAIRGVAGGGQTRPRNMTRMEFADALTQDYLDKRMQWELHRDEMVSEAERQNDPKAMEAVTRRLARITGIENAKLYSKYADAVVRGHSHTVRELMGHLDVRTTAEMLQDAKDSLRESALSSLYTASLIYPVQMQPADWFQSLDTSFTREDLSQSSDLLEAAMRAKASMIDGLQTQIANLRGFATIDPATAKASVEAAARVREKAIEDLAGAYTESTVSAVKLALEAATASTPVGAASLAGASMAESVMKKIKTLPDTDKQKSKLKAVLGDDFEKVDEIGRQIDKVTAANNGVNSASRKLAELMSQSALAQAGDTKILVENLQRTLSSAKQELQDLTESYAIAIRKEKAKTADEEKLKTTEEIGKLPAGASGGGGGTRWIELSLASRSANKASETSSMASSSTSSWNCNFWIGSYSKNSSTAEAKVKSELKSTEFGVDISMRVSYVTVDRSGWFDPSILELSGSFMHTVADEDYTPWSVWPLTDGKKTIRGQDVDLRVPKAASEVVQDVVAGGERASAIKGYLQAFAVGYVFVKDCVIRVTSAELKESTEKSNFERQSQESGGFLCFSHSSASHDAGDSSRSSTTQTSDGMVIRIPGPQLLGYMMQMTPPDQSRSFAPMPDDYLFEEMDRIDKAAAQGRQPASANSVRPSDAFSSANAALPETYSGVRGYDVSSAPPRGTAASTSSSPAAPKAAASAVDPSAASDPLPPKFSDTLRNLVASSSTSKMRSLEEQQAVVSLIEKLLGVSP